MLYFSTQFVRVIFYIFLLIDQHIGLIKLILKLFKKCLNVLEQTGYESKACENLLNMLTSLTQIINFLTQR